ncbi:hypothetical protein SAMN05421594_1400 [Chryseobacterium oleae]|uniref:GLPGLI family protein n=1 Tax=Chryseobacterium oleae TaxID=491207 RepID=A0A1I4WQ28_CHROL|nr:hypothetical protein [Chryseobacterium oleae]SFN15283.1 hypothetical protein SAMN05421594_1400 [Chryseobacterium oleae]
MKKYIFILILFTNMALAQDLEIDIPISRIELTPGNNNLCYNIKNNSRQYYKILIDSTGFSTGENEIVDEPYLGLLNFRIYDGERLLNPVSGSYAYEKNLKNANPSNKELLTFRELYMLDSTNISELYIFYKIYKRIINIPPKKSIALCTKISFPIYNSSADNGSLFYDIKNEKEYYFQLHLNIPKKMLKKFSKILDQKSEKYIIFSGIITSNKVNIILKNMN